MTRLVPLWSVLLALAVAGAPGCASNPTPHPFEDSGAFEPNESDTTSTPTQDVDGRFSDNGTGSVGDVGTTPGPADAASDVAPDASGELPGDASGDLPEDGSDGDVGPDGSDGDVDPDGDAGPDAGCDPVALPDLCCCDLDVTAQPVCDAGEWGCPSGYGLFSGTSCTEDCGPCNYAPACQEQDAGSGTPDAG